jgi:predicted DNA-binding transcriptional regulator AlpA
MAGRNGSTEAARRIGIAALEQRLSVERSTIWRWYRAGAFPPPHYIGNRRAWWLHDIEAWEVQQMARLAPEGKVGAGEVRSVRRGASGDDLRAVLADIEKLAAKVRSRLAQQEEQP